MKKTLLFLLILFVSCDKSGPTEYGPAMRNPVFKAGDRVTYRWSAGTVDSTGDTLASVTDTADVSVVGVDETVGTLDSLVRIDVLSYSSRGVSSTWYRQSGTDFVEVAYRFGSGGTPLAQPIILTKGGTSFPLKPVFSASTPAILGALFRERIVVDSIYLREDPRVVYRYPFVLGQQWISFTQPFLQVREVQAESTVTVIGIPEQCAVIKTTIPEFLATLNWLDYVNNAGLRKRSLIFPGLIVTTVGNPEGMSEATAYEELEIIPAPLVNQ